MALMSKRGPFFDRYCITTELVLFVGIVVFLARRSRLNRVAGMLVLLALLVLTGKREVPYLAEVFYPTTESGARLDQIQTDLPFVAGNALTFLEMDHHEGTAFLSRVYYLTDRPSALRYAQTDLMEGIGALKQYFPIRASIVPYYDFVGKYRHFLVCGSIERPEDWLLRKLVADGAQISKIGEFKTPYQDKSLYDVKLARPENVGPKGFDSR